MSASPSRWRSSGTHQGGSETYAGEEQLVSIEFTWLVNGPIRICIEKRQCIFNGREVHLGDIEFRLLSLFVKDPGVLHEHNELLNKVWGANALGEVQYLRVACARLRRKV